MGDSFNELGGIAKERRRINQEMSVLEKLLIINDKLQNISSILNPMVGISVEEGLERKYQAFKKIVQDSLKEDIINTNDLKTFIEAVNPYNSNKDYSRNLGIFTGCMLDIICEKNREQGKITSFYMNGKDKEFNNLFFIVRNVDELILENFRGSGIAENIAFDCAKVGLFIANNLKDTNIHNLCHNGNIDYFVSTNHISSFISMGNGKVGNLIFPGPADSCLIDVDEYSHIRLLLSSGLKDLNFWRPSGEKCEDWTIENAIFSKDTNLSQNIMYGSSDEEELYCSSMEWAWENHQSANRQHYHDVRYSKHIKAKVLLSPSQVEGLGNLCEKMEGKSALEIKKLVGKIDNLYK